MKKEIYITILLFAFMLFALISTVVRGQPYTARTTVKRTFFHSNDKRINADWHVQIKKVGYNFWVKGSIQ